MTSFSDELAVIRRFLRDPDGAIWSDEDIRIYWNDSQYEVASRTGYLETANAYKYPPEWTWCHTHYWEHGHAEGDRYQCLIIWQARDAVVCYPWEAGYWLENSETADDGIRFAIPWEAHYCSPADYVPVPFHRRFHRAKFIAYDEEALEYIERKRLAEKDGHYRTTAGSPQRYWRPDQEGNIFVLYPRPSAVTWDDAELVLSPLESYDDEEGQKTWEEAYVDYKDKGVITDTIGTDGRILAIFDHLPKEVDAESFSEDLDIPAFFTKYVRYATLERCYSANTDGFIPSLRDYWGGRKEMGIRAVKRFRALRKTDRDYRLGGPGEKGERRHPRLPAGYPAINP